MKMREISEKFSKKVTYVSFFMAIFVVYIHANNLAYYGISNEQFSIPNMIVKIGGGVLGGVAVPFFFMLSAYWLFRFNVFDNNADKILWKKLKRKIKTIMVPYLLWNTFGMLFYMLITHIPFAAKMMNNGEIINITFSNIIGGIVFHKYYFTFWYLQDLIVLMALSPIILRLLRKKTLTILLLAVNLIVTFFQIDLVIFKSTSLLFFVIGAFISVYGRDFFENESNYAGIYLGLFIVTGILRYFEFPIISQISLFVAPVLLWKGIDVIIQNKVYEKKNSWFVTQSFFIYASHVIPVTIIGHILAKVKSGYIWVTISYLITPWITLGLIYVSAVIIHKYIPRFYNLICGGRS